MTKKWKKKANVLKRWLIYRKYLKGKATIDELYIAYGLKGKGVKK